VVEDKMRPCLPGRSEGSVPSARRLAILNPIKRVLFS
jgi:hypothetical protein